tara:strand:+ start:99 stop:416 length:318 start_codon:yes stop_codon:yes gene_type:complete
MDITQFATLNHPSAQPSDPDEFARLTRDVDGGSWAYHGTTQHEVGILRKKAMESQEPTRENLRAYFDAAIDHNIGIIKYSQDNIPRVPAFERIVALVADRDRLYY